MPATPNLSLKKCDAGSGDIAWRLNGCGKCVTSLIMWGLILYDQVKAPLSAFPVTYKYVIRDAKGVAVLEHGENRIVALQLGGFPWCPSEASATSKHYSCRSSNCVFYCQLLGFAQWQVSNMCGSIA
jgi:hypothetical protein